MMSEEAVNRVGAGQDKGRVRQDAVGISRGRQVEVD